MDRYVYGIGMSGNNHTTIIRFIGDITGIANLASPAHVSSEYIVISAGAVKVGEIVSSRITLNVH